MPALSPDNNEEEARDLLGRIIEALTAVLKEHVPSSGFPDTVVASRWNGEIEIEEFAFHSGVIHADGSIAILRLVWETGRSDRHRTLIHEALHSFSPPFTIRSYREHRGWEEGVVEALQRLLRQEVLGTIGVEIAEADFVEGDRRHLYSPYIETLEVLRSALGQNVVSFYVGLLLTPLEQRANRVRRFGEALSDPQHRGAFATTLMLADARLRRPIHGF